MKHKAKKTAEELLKFIGSCPTAYHTASTIKNILKDAGFEELSEKSAWNLVSGKGYYVERNGSALAAFISGKSSAASGFLIAGAHTDSPGFKIKNLSETKTLGTTRLFVEQYGGPILSSWLDRDLSIAGVVRLRGKTAGDFRLVDLKLPVAVIPNLAIHLNREINKGFEYNVQTHMPVIISASENGEDLLKKVIAREIDCRVEDLSYSDLFLYDSQKGHLSGFDQDLLVSGRLDNLAGCHAVLTALIAAEESEKTTVGIFFDNEEVGSRSLQGADSGFLMDILDRITIVRGGSEEDRFRARAASFLISVDGAHAVHPSYADKHDVNYSPRLNGGPVIKMNAGFKYATTSETAAYFEGLCRTADVPFQQFAMRSDLPCGSTIGPLTSSLIGIKTVDIGIPMLGMHSIRETTGVKDQYYMIEALKAFYRQG